jgi:hypothetical protein
MLKSDVCVLVLALCLAVFDLHVMVGQLNATCDGDGNGACNTWMSVTDCCMNAGGFQGYSKTAEGTGTPWLEEVPGQQCAERFDWWWAMPCSDSQGPCGGHMGQPC